MSNNKKFAFFDVDQTVVNFKTLIDFEEFWLSYQSSKKQTEEESNSLQKRKHFIRETLRKLPRKQANLLFYEGFKGRSKNELSELIQLWFETLKKKPNKEYYNMVVISKLKRLQKNNIEPVFVSGSFIELINKFAIELNVKNLLATRLTIESGIYTGEIIGNPVIGEGKKTAIKNFLQNFKVPPQDCYGFGDHVSDAPFLQYVGKSFIVKGDKQLEDLAKKRSWEIISN